ncbi:unnamed protein product, partial [Symbiodinium necroappetens]
MVFVQDRFGKDAIFRQSSLAIHRTFRGPDELLSILVSFSKAKRQHSARALRHSPCAARRQRQGSTLCPRCAGTKLLSEEVLDFSLAYLRSHRKRPNFVFTKLYGWHTTQDAQSLPLLDRTVASHLAKVFSADSQNGDIVFVGSDHGRLDLFYLCEQRSPFLHFYKSRSAIVALSYKDSLVGLREAKTSAEWEAFLDTHANFTREIFEMYEDPERILTWF